MEGSVEEIGGGMVGGMCEQLDGRMGVGIAGEVGERLGGQMGEGMDGGVWMVE